MTSLQNDIDEPNTLYLIPLTFYLSPSTSYLLPLTFYF